MGAGGNKIWEWFKRSLFYSLVPTLLFCSSVQADPFEQPQPDPPKVDLGMPSEPVLRTTTRNAPPTQEWTFHKTSDNLHPDGNEQQMMWLMNRARTNPSQEGAWLADTGDAQVENAIAYYDVDLDIMQDEFDVIAATPPAAFDVRLYRAAKAHSDDLIARDAQDHTGQFDRIDAEGFVYTSGRGNVFSYTRTALYGHAGFNIDWGDDGGDGSGMQPGRGHRLAIMSIDGDYTNVGIAVVAESDPATKVGPLVTTGDFCHANTDYDNHHNRFLVGTVWQDDNANNLYDPGEGMSGIVVAPDQGTYFAVTADSGGYAIPISTAGTYTVTFSGPGIDPAVTRMAVVADNSVLLDLDYDAGSSSAPQAATGTASNLSSDSADLNGTIVTKGLTTTYYFEYGLSTTYGTETPADSISTDSSVTVGITGLSEDTTYHFRLVASNAGGTAYGDDLTFQTKASSSSGSDDDVTPGSDDDVTPSAPGGGGGGGGGCFIFTAAGH